MNPKRKRQLLWIAVMLTGLSVATGLILYSLRAQANYFYAPVDLVADKAGAGKRIRAGGMVVNGSIERVPDSLTVRFKITDFKATVPVLYTGILPDLFKENSGVVGTGRMRDGVFVAEEILAKHDENYMPPEVGKTLAKTAGAAAQSLPSQAAP